MTISLGGIGTLWFRSIVTVYVKPARYTHQFMDDNDYFTVSFYPEKYRDALTLMGSRSGRDIDKDAASGLTVKDLGKAITYEEAEETLLCKKIYKQDLDTEAMPAEVVQEYYSEDAPHTMYLGEVVEIIR